ncbi:MULTISPECIES: polysaccharide deacetylase family protein [unclassified Frankia]|uniref:polysaccharide deacetylase family protein n=1 Tax=unclassified Frankia TaxID=2632575 RepID=UPI002024DFFA
MPRHLLRRTAAAGAAATGTVAAVHALPALTSVPGLRRRLVPGLAGVGDPGHVALTFDDGPDPTSTPRFLEALAAHEVRATFFLLGSMLVRAPELGRDLVQAGHEVAVHGWEHRYFVLRGPTATYDDLARARDLVGDVTGQTPAFFRPPYGVLSTAVLRAARRLRLRPVLWTAWGKDWSSRATPRSVLDTVRRDLVGGGTVLLHDSDCTSAPGAWRSALGALPALLDECAGRGLRVGPLREHLAPRAGGEVRPTGRLDGSAGRAAPGAAEGAPRTATAP